MWMWNGKEFSFLNLESFESLRQLLNKHLCCVELFLLLAKTKCRICINLKCDSLFIKDPFFFFFTEYSISTP